MWNRFEFTLFQLQKYDIDRDMAFIRNSLERVAQRRAIVTTAVVVVVGAMALTIGRPGGAAGNSGLQDTLAELAARSPGARIGGVALKGKGKGKSRAVLASAAAPEPAAETPIANVLPVATTPVNPAPQIVLGEFPTAVAIPGTAAPAPALPGFAPVFPGIGGGGFVIGPGGGGGGGGGTGVVTPTPTPTPTPNPTVTPTPPPVPAIPEPSTWFMLILGFGVVGGAMRGKRRVALA